jgi:endonuclease/exonuclease/phosphatase family metal-dependent hydrolase
MVSGLCLTVTMAGTDEAKSLKSLELRVMTFNIRTGTAKDGANEWKLRKDLVFEVFHNEKPDVAGLQEPFRFQLDELEQALPEYDRVGIGREDGKTQGEYSAILYKKEFLEVQDSGTFWFSDTPEVPGSITWGNACTRICTWARFLDKRSGRSFYHFNLHIDHVSQPSRIKSVRLLADRIARRQFPKDPFVVTGDFNVGESNPVIQYLLGKENEAKDGTAVGPAPSPVIGLDKSGEAVKDGATSGTQIRLVDTFRVAHPDATEAGTFCEFVGKKTGDKIDYILVPTQTEVLGAEIVRWNKDGRYPSDHFPVTARIRFGAMDN